MLSSSAKLIIPLVCLFIATSSLGQSHELALHRRDHGSIKLKRFLKNRSLQDDLGSVVGNAANLPTASADSQIATSTVSQSTASDTQTTLSLTSTSATSTSTGTASTTAASNRTTSTTSAPTSSSAPTNASSTSTSTSQTSPTINLTPLPVANTANVVASTITSTQSISATPSDTSVPQLQSASSKTKTATVTALIAIAASLGGIAILWTIFRKWKLSSSKEFDRRLNPITDWQPTNGEDDIIPALRRAPSSSSSFHSGGGSANGHSSSRSAGFVNEHSLAPPEHDFTAGPGNSAPIGGYADLARASSPNPPMQQALGRGPSFNHGYEVGVPLHHQTGYGTYDYNGGGVRY